MTAVYNGEQTVTFDERVQAILLRPKAEWPVIEQEPGDVGHLFLNYVMILPIIPLLCAAISGAEIGFGRYRIGAFENVFHALAVYVLTLVGVFFIAHIVNLLAPMFGGQKNLGNAMRVAAYAPTAFWIAGFFKLLLMMDITAPWVSKLSLLGLYSLFLLYTGLGALMRPAGPVKTLLYTVAVTACAVGMYFAAVGVFALIYGVDKI